jgi:hypothetical protein
MTDFGHRRHRQYGSDRKPANRYIVHQTVLVRSTRGPVLAASQQIEVGGDRRGDFIEH